MRCLHLFEFGDQPWFPQALRDAETAYLAVGYRLLPLARLWAERISTVVDPGEPVEIVDLCSGSGGPMPLIIGELEARGHEARATPNRSLSESEIRFSSPHPVAGRTGGRNACATKAGRRADDVFLVSPLSSGCGQNNPKRRLRGSACDLHLRIGVRHAARAHQHDWRSCGRARANAFCAAVPLGLSAVYLPDSGDATSRVLGRQRLDAPHLQAPDYAWEIGRIQLRGIVGGLPYLIGRPIR